VFKDCPDGGIEAIHAAKGGVNDGQDFLLIRRIITAALMRIKIGECRLNCIRVHILLVMSVDWYWLDVTDLPPRVNVCENLNYAPQAAQVSWTTQDHQPFATNQRNWQGSQVRNNISLVDATLVEPKTRLSTVRCGE